MLLDVSKLVVHQLSRMFRNTLISRIHALRYFLVVGNGRIPRHVELRVPCCSPLGVRPIPKPRNSNQLDVGFGSGNGTEILEAFVFRLLNGPFRAHQVRRCAGRFADTRLDRLFAVRTDTIGMNRLGLWGTAFE